MFWSESVWLCAVGLSVCVCERLLTRSSSAAVTSAQRWSGTARAAQPQHVASYNDLHRGGQYIHDRFLLGLSAVRGFLQRGWNWRGQRHICCLTSVETCSMTPRWHAPLLRLLHRASLSSLSSLRVSFSLWPPCLLSFVGWLHAHFQVRHIRLFVWWFVNFMHIFLVENKPNFRHLTRFITVSLFVAIWKFYVSNKDKRNFLIFSGEVVHFLFLHSFIQGRCFFWRVSFQNE